MIATVHNCEKLNSIRVNFFFGNVYVVGVKIPDKTNFLNVQSLNEHKKKNYSLWTALPNET
jgi:hypothetical protein